MRFTKLAMLILIAGMLIGVRIAKAITPIEVKSTSQKGQIALNYNRGQTIQEIDCLFTPPYLGSDYDFQLYNETKSKPKFNFSTITLSYGVTDDFEVFARFGSINMEASRKTYLEQQYNSYWSGDVHEIETSKETFNLDTNLFGIGANINLRTLYNNRETQEEIVLGMGTSLDWMRLSGERSNLHSFYSERTGGPPYEDGEYEYTSNYSSPRILDILSGKMSLNLKYTKKNISFYGGPIVQCLYIVKSSPYSYSSIPYPISENYSVNILGYIGSSLKITDDITISGNYQFGENSKTISGGLTYVF